MITLFSPKRFEERVGGAVSEVRSRVQPDHMQRSWECPFLVHRQHQITDKRPSGFPPLVQVEPPGYKRVAGGGMAKEEGRQRHRWRRPQTLVRNRGRKGRLHRSQHLGLEIVARMSCSWLGSYCCRGGPKHVRSQALDDRTQRDPVSNLLLVPGAANFSGIMEPAGILPPAGQ